MWSPKINEADHKWEEIKKALQAYQQEQKRLWGDADEWLVAKYLAGTCTEEEKAFVEKEIESHPRLRDCIEFLKRAME